VSLAVNQISAPSGDHAIPRALVHIFVSVFVFPDKSVTILESGNRLLMGTSPKAAAHAASVLAARGVDIVTGEQLEGSERPTDDMFGDGGEAITSGGRVISYDLMIWCTGGRPDTAYMADDFPEVLDTNRRIMVTPGLMVAGQQRLFAMGDVTNLPENKLALHTKGHVKVVETPETVNEDPYGEGWLVRIRLSNPGERDQLLSVADYRKVVDEQ